VVLCIRSIKCTMTEPYRVQRNVGARNCVICVVYSILTIGISTTWNRDRCSHVNNVGIDGKLVGVIKSST
jgi:hypothetical protein